VRQRRAYDEAAPKMQARERFGGVHNRDTNFFFA
jgi:hypothetical protein